MIRLETPNDIQDIEELTLAAFTGVYSDDPTEHMIVNGLREAGALSLSLVTEIDERIIGHIAFSAVTIDGADKSWSGLGPISVLPEFQNQGIGSALIKKGLVRIRELGAKGCVLTGSPDYYPRFGFKSYPQLYYEGVEEQKYFMAMPFYNDVPEGKVEYHNAFYL